MPVTDCYGLVHKPNNAMKKILPAMKLTAVWLLATMLTAWGRGDAQQITLSQKNVPLQTIFQELKKQTGFTFVYTQAIIQKAKRVTVNVKNASLDDVLTLCFREQPLTYSIVNKMVVIKEREQVRFASAEIKPESADIIITGRVLSDSGRVIQGASVTVVGSTKGVPTGVDGKFSIEVALNTTIAVSAIGYETKLIKITSGAPLEIRLSYLSQNLDQIIVIGYGTQRKSDLTGAVSSVNSATIEKSGVTSIDQVLQGRVAGVQMTQNSGLPGGGSSIQIRGLSSVNSTNEPIYVIDGVIISSGTGSYSSNAFSAINTNDIESVEILKDASAAAIYGAQGANGVIIITTKKGKPGPPRLAFDAKYGKQSLPKYLPMSNLQEYAQHLNEFYILKGWAINDYFANPSLLSKGTNWQKEIFRPASLQNYNLSVSGGNEITTYRISGNYLKQDGVASGSGFDRITASGSIDTKLKSWAKMGGTMTLSRTSQIITIADWDLINSAVRQSPSVPARNLDGTYGGPEDPNDALSNPLALSKLLDKGNKRIGIRGNVYLEVKPISTLSVRTEFATDLGQEMTHTFIPTYKLGGRYNSEITNQQTQRYSNNYSWRNVVTYNPVIGKLHTLNAMLGQELTERTYNYIYAKRRGGSNQLQDIDAGDALTAENGGNTGRASYASFFGRAFYSFRNRYMITATLRYDGSSNFAEGHKWGVFPSTAIAWKISDEPFFKNIRTINNLKLRLGYGKVGNSNIRQFAYTANIANVPTIWGNGALIANVPNPEVTWESTQSYNLGLDLSLLNNRIELVADVYLKRTDNLLLELTLPGITGAQQGGPPGSASAPWANVGSLQNKGIELSLNATNYKTKDFTWTSNVVFTVNRNKILKLNAESAFINKTYQMSGTTYIVSRTEAGRSIGEFWGYKTIGRINSADDIYDKNGQLKIAIPEKQKIDRNSGIWVGDLIWDDYNHDGVINQDDRQYLGSPLPLFTYGFGNTFVYKNFDLNIFFTGTYGNKVLNFLNLAIDDPNTTGNITRRAGMDYAHPGLKDPNGTATDVYNVYVSGGDGSMPRMSLNDVNSNNRLSSRFVEDGSFLRLQNVSLSYTFPKKAFTRLGMNNVRVYVNAQNVYTFTKYSGYDPEVGMTKDQYSATSQNALLNGIDPGRYPTPRSFTIGLSLGL
jgi:TonB-dependent starch-binding outer membrane protein SusC